MCPQCGQTSRASGCRATHGVRTGLDGVRAGMKSVRASANGVRPGMQGVRTGSGRVCMGLQGVRTGSPRVRMGPDGVRSGTERACTHTVRVRNGMQRMCTGPHGVPPAGNGVRLWGQGGRKGGHVACRGRQGAPHERPGSCDRGPWRAAPDRGGRARTLGGRGVRGVGARCVVVVCGRCCGVHVGRSTHIRPVDPLVQGGITNAPGLRIRRGPTANGNCQNGPARPLGH